MSISRFDQGALGPNLLVYFNPTEVPPTVQNTDEVVSLAPVYGRYTGLAVPLFDERFPLAPVYDPASPPTVGTAGLLKALSFPSFSDHSLKHDHPVTNYPEGITIVTTVEPTGNNAYSGTLGVVNGGSSRISYWAGNSSPRNHKAYYVSSVLRDTGIAYPQDVATTIVLTQDGMPDPEILTGDATHHVKNEGSDSATHTFADISLAVSSDEFRIGCEGRDFAQSLHGNMAIFAVYDRKLTPGEIADVQELCDYWMANGEAPPVEEVEYPLSAEFGPVLPNDLGATLVCEVLLDSDTNRDNWQPATTTLSNSRLVTEIVAGNSVNNNKLIVDSGIVSDSCQVRFRAVASYGSIITFIARLTVVEPAA